MLSRPTSNLLAWFVLLALIVSVLFVASAAAQYGGVSGIFVEQEPDDPYTVVVEGVGCERDSEVVLYMPDLSATKDDPLATIDVPGRVLAVTTALADDDPLINGTFNFGTIRLPADLTPGEYEIHARCVDQDLQSLIIIPARPVASTTTTPATTTTAPPSVTPQQLPLTGASTQRGLAVATVLIGLGTMLVVFARRTS